MSAVPKDAPDTDIVSAIKASNDEALQVLYHRYYEHLFRFIWHKTNHTETTQDIAQETFLRLWKNRHKLDAQRSIKAYLFRIANNLVIDYLRKKRLEQAHFTDPPLIDPGVEPDEQFELRDKIQDAVHGLPEPLHTVFSLSRFQGLKYAEIADALNISVKTVESRMSKALVILRDKLQPFL